MSEYIVSARKYRPMSWSQVVGQDSLTTTLKNAIRTGRLAHAYLFCGPRGVGKTTSARIFARTINCLAPTEDYEACGKCESCQAFNEGRSFNIHELDAASNNSVDDIRQLTEQVLIPPQVGRYKVFIIDEVHMLSTAAFNAFLKTLEEPPAHVIFILATTEKHKILPTILSRCQTFDFNRMSVADTVRHLRMVAEREGYTVEDEALAVIAQKADGGMRDALSIFDQVAGYTQGHITYDKVIENLNVLDYDYYFKMIDLLLEKKIAESMLLLDEVLKKGFDAGHFISGLASHLRNLMMSRDEMTHSLLQCSDMVRERYRQQAGRCNDRFIYRALKLCNNCDVNYRSSHNKRLLVEVTLVSISGADDDPAGRCPAKSLPIIFEQLEPRVQAAPAPSVPSATVSEHQAKPTAPAVKILRLSETPKIKATPTAPQPVQTITPSYTIEPQQETVPLNDDTLRDLWTKFIRTMSHEDVALQKKMQLMQPLLTGDNCFDVLVGNAMVEADLQEHRHSIETYISSAIGGAAVQMRIQVDENNDSEFMPLPEVFNEMLTNCLPVKLVKDFFELELV